MFDEFANRVLETGGIAAVVAILVPLISLLYSAIKLHVEKKSIEKSLELRKWTIIAVPRLRKIGRLTAVRVRVEVSDIRSFEKVKGLYMGATGLEDMPDLSAAASSGATTEFDKFKASILPGYRAALFAVLNAELLRAGITAKLSSLEGADSKSSSVLGVMLGRRMKSYAKAYMYLFASFTMAVAAFFFLPNVGVTPMVASSAMTVLVLINQKVLAYRVSRGYFGNNSAEAKEFIRFIQDHSDKSDFSDGDKMKRLMSDIKSQRLGESVVHGGVPA